MSPLPPAVETQAASELLGWVLGQSAALAVALLWIVSLLRQRFSEQAERSLMRQELSASHERNALLSDYLCRQIESASREQSRLRDRHLFQLDSTNRSHADLFRQVLDSALTTPESSAECSEHETPP